MFSKKVNQTILSLDDGHLLLLRIGFVCLPILRNEEDYKASIFLDEVLEKVRDIIDNPDTSVPYNEGSNTLFLLHPIHLVFSFRSSQRI